MKTSDYKGFVKHVECWDNLDIAYGLNDLKELASIYNCSIPKEYIKTKRRVKND